MEHISKSLDRKLRELSRTPFEVELTREPEPRVRFRTVSRDENQGVIRKTVRSYDVCVSMIPGLTGEETAHELARRALSYAEAEALA